MANYRFTKDAEQDLVEIWNYTATTWSEAQADADLEQIHAYCENLRRNIKISKRPLKAFPTLHSLRCEQHFLFFLLLDQPSVIAVLHGKMDVIARLRKRLSDD